MRIITGRARGVTLLTLEGEATRPTADRVKEALFSMLQFDIEGRRVLDLFAGSGQLSLEAISRGAREAVLVDKSREATKIIQKNIEKTKFTSECQVVSCDYLQYIRQSRGEKFDIVFIDPPYAAGLYESSLEGLLDADMLKSTSIVVCESETEDILGNNARLTDAFCVRRVARYGRVVLTILEVRGN